MVQTTTGGTNTVFATTGLLGDSNLLQHAIQNAVFGTTPSLSLDITRMAGIVTSRTDMDQSQFPSDVSPGAGQPGIYDALIPILQQWKQQYNFVGSYYVNIGDNANPANENSTNWAVSAPYYRRSSPWAARSAITPIPTSSIRRPSTPTAIRCPHPVNGVPVSTWNENTNTLYVTPPANGSAPNWTFNYEFGQSKTIEQQNIGITIAGAAVPGAAETVEYVPADHAVLPDGSGRSHRLRHRRLDRGRFRLSQRLRLHRSRPIPARSTSRRTSPSTSLKSSFSNKTPEQALADWQALFNQLSANSAGADHRMAVARLWRDQLGYQRRRRPDPGYTTQMFTDFIAYAYNAGYEFVTVETLAARIAAQQKATISETTNGNVITATITPDPTAPDLGGMALNVINGATGQVIQNAGTWYAYDSDSIFLPRNGGTFNVTLGTTQDDVTHIDALPMRADLLSVTGDGANLAFSMTGDGVVDVHVKTPGANIVSIQGAPPPR